MLDSLYGLSNYIKNHLDNAFLSLLNPENVDKRIKGCFDLIYNSAGNLPIETISHTVGLSPRQLRRIVNNMIGLSLKDYAKIIRFKKSLQNIKMDKSDYLYHYDQSHFIRDVKQFTGQTPEKLQLGINDRFIQYYDF